MIDDVVEFLLGPILELLPMDISRAARLRRYRKGQRVFFRGTVSGLPRTRWTTWLAAERGRLWAATRKGDAEGLVPIPLPDHPTAVVYNQRVTWSKSRTVVVEVDHTCVEIMPNAVDWELLRLAIAESIGERNGESCGSPDG